MFVAGLGGRFALRANTHCAAPRSGCASAMGHPVWWLDVETQVNFAKLGHPGLGRIGERGGYSLMHGLWLP
jgi:hypothetical protein